MTGISKKEADAHDRLMDAASELTDLMADSGIDISEPDREELSLILARNAPKIRKILSRAKKARPLTGPSP